TADRNRSHWSTSKTPSYTKSVSWQHHQKPVEVNHYQAEIELYPDKIALSFLFLSGFSPYRNNFNG
ncbi:hypothetical protein, partial [Escherichia coli]|uniref:hypothetical protein n=3 Tax=Escherichia coli TaxID=562 RepID=UPI00201F131B